MCKKTNEKCIFVVLCYLSGKYTYQIEDYFLFFFKKLNEHLEKNTKKF